MSMNARLAQKLNDLPRSPGVYLHKDASGEVIYVGNHGCVMLKQMRWWRISPTLIGSKQRAK